MKWNNKAKERLYKAIRAKMEQKNWVLKNWGDIRDRPHALLSRFLDKFGVVQVRRAESINHGQDDSRPLGHAIRRWTYCWDLRKEDARSSRHVIIPHPQYGPECPKGLWKDMQGIKIPKDVAEKFLVLGIP